ncbi:MAG: ABC transporter ATP-binding protein [Deltaproteobacteria bacterium]|nr:ABC transporter ATP-binding protein [Deltaproteobacteria bacterium]MBW2016649.1 ABC transporter ATP-binding protein [Deltaproteobacteria bacterium]MBW2128819.1 ABC transporter ATP-binding protein [Deltaproteobacteria bacterium]MBW2303757.1 ABC transporter ATP-binding protein [Deltaproteobacteria bacterium]
MVPTKVYLGTLLLVVLLLPPLLGNYWTQVMGDIGIYIMLGIGLNVVIGFAGLLDLGYVAFFGIGAYSYALLASPQYGIHIPFWLMLPVCIALAALGGTLLGIPVLKLRGDYLAIVTLGFGEIIRIVLNNLDPVTNGPKGLLRIDPPTIGNFTVDSPMKWYYMILAGIIFSIFVADRLNNSRLGRAWVAMREDQDAAALMGINILRTKLLAFTIGASFAGIGGAIFAARQGSIFPENFGIMVSINVLCLIIIGGMGSITGVTLGAIVLIGLPEVLRDVQEYRMLAFGGLLVAMMIFRPTGFIPSARRKMEFKKEE